MIYIRALEKGTSSQLLSLFIFMTRLSLEDIPVNTLPRESRLVLTLFGRTQRAVDASHQNDNKEQTNQEETDGDVQYEQVELGWAAIQMFDYDG